jgi:hypothetical protein
MQRTQESASDRSKKRSNSGRFLTYAGQLTQRPYKALKQPLPGATRSASSPDIRLFFISFPG